MLRFTFSLMGSSRRPIHISSEFDIEEELFCRFKTLYVGSQSG
jgi:hypothetical protein